MGDGRGRRRRYSRLGSAGCNGGLGVRRRRRVRLALIIDDTDNSDDHKQDDSRYGNPGSTFRPSPLSTGGPGRTPGWSRSNAGRTFRSSRACAGGTGAGWRMVRIPMRSSGHAFVSGWVGLRIWPGGSPASPCREQDTHASGAPCYQRLQATLGLVPQLSRRRLDLRRLSRNSMRPSRPIPVCLGPSSL